MGGAKTQQTGARMSCPKFVGKGSPPERQETPRGCRSDDCRTAHTEYRRARRIAAARIDRDEGGSPHRDSPQLPNAPRPRPIRPRSYDESRRPGETAPFGGRAALRRRP